ncbi:MAG: carbohydrate binding domain-containing protein [Candidatus Omnitrophota bacterium]
MKALLFFLTASAVALAVVLMVSGQVFAAALVIADFNTGEKPNNIGGDFGAWNRDEADQTQGCKMNFNQTEMHGGAGSSVQLDYDVDSPNPAYNGFWMKLQNQDASQYDKLSLWIKGDAAAGYSAKVKLELKNAKGEVGKYTVSNITAEWQEIVIPLAQFSGLTDLTSMTELVVVFDDMTCSGKKQGTIYIDDIAFVK